jgi:hypothetical protein
MLRGTTDMSETPDEILRALADALDLPVKRVRTHAY